MNAGHPRGGRSAHSRKARVAKSCKEGMGRLGKHNSQPLAHFMEHSLLRHVENNCKRSRNCKRWCPKQPWWPQLAPGFAAVFACHLEPEAAPAAPLKGPTRPGLPIWDHCSPSAQLQTLLSTVLHHSNISHTLNRKNSCSFTVGTGWAPVHVSQAGSARQAGRTLTAAAVRGTGPRELPQLPPGAASDVLVCAEWQTVNCTRLAAGLM